MLLLGLCISVSHAQTENYRKLVREWIETGANGNTLSVDMLKSVYVEINKVLFDSIDIDVVEKLSVEQKQKLAEDVADKYVKEQLVEDLSDVFASMWKGKVTEEQLQELVEMTRTERAKGAIARMNEATKNLQQDVVQMISPLIASMMLGTEPEPVEAAECSDSYKQAFHDYYEESEAGNILGAMDKTFQALEAQNNAETKKIVQKTIDYMRANLEVWMRNMMVGNVTEDDLRYWKEMAATPAYKRVMFSIQNELLANPMSFATLLLEKYGKWLDDNGDSLIQFIH